ncbi:MAG: thiamine pyrophosphate-dependent enzyme, partial [Burkholderiaceae bacterium]
KRVRADVPIVGDVKDVLTDMLAQLREMNFQANPAKIEKWWEQINAWRAIDSLSYDRSSQLVKPQKVIETLHRLTNGEAFITSDVGQHQMFAAQYYPFDKPRRWINSGGLGTMGVGIPYAMGVKKLHPDADVCCITGEGSVQMCIQELSTCKEYELPIKILSLNNGYLGMVRQWQELQYDERYSQTYF